MIEHLTRKNARFFLVFLFALSACSVQPPQPRAVDDTQRCLAFYAVMDQHVASARVVDAQAERIEGFPFLRTDRYLASFRDELQDDSALRDWLIALRDTDRHARDIEFRNLPLAQRNALATTLPLGDSVNSAFTQCSAKLTDMLLHNTQAVNTVKANAKVASSYDAALQTLGLYPLSSRFLARQVRAYQQAQRAVFATSLAKLPVQGKLRRYAPVVSETISLHTPATSRFYPNADWQTLFARHAPMWEIDTASNDDVPGEIYWQDRETVAVDTHHPISYLLPSFTRFNGATLIQLNYLIWFPARTARHSLDLYAGSLDGIFWRVTLDENGKPLLYEAVHSCGCYHMAFPVTGLNARLTHDEREPLLVMQTLPQIEPEQRWIVRVSAGEHGVQNIRRATIDDASKSAQSYTLVTYDQLRSLPTAWGTQQSMFDVHGVVPQSARLERHLLWVSGVSNAGAMRQWGRHPIAFADERHLDDPSLLDRYFTRQ